MAQIAQIVMWILGLCNAASLKVVCIVSLCCEVVRIICEIIEKRSK